MIYFCLPACNQAATVGLSIYKIGEVMKDVDRGYELVVLDDGSTDETADVVHSYERILPLRLIRRETREGYGSSLRELLRDVTKRSNFPERDVVATIEADFSQSPTPIPAMIREIEAGADVVIASSFAEGSRMIQIPLAFRVLNGGLHLLLRNLYGVRGVRDYLSTFRIYRVNLLRRALDRFGDDIVTLPGRSANTELLLNLNALGVRIAEVPLVLRRGVRGSGEGPPARRIGWEYARMITRLWLNRR